MALWHAPVLVLQCSTAFWTQEWDVPLKPI